MQLVGTLDKASWGDLANIWGYVAPNGTEYALIGAEMGVSIISLANPSSPVEVQFLPGIQTIWREIKTFGTYAYVSNEGGDGLRIINLSNLPGPVTYKDTTIEGIVKSHSVSETDGYLYVNGFNSNGGFKVFNLTPNPWIPQFMGEYNTRYVHDCYVRDDIMYAGEIYDGMFTIIDVSNKANPQVLSNQTYVNSFTHNTWLNDASTFCFTTDEKDEAYVYAWDISNPASPFIVDDIRGSQSAGLSIPHNIHVLNDYGVTSYYKDGVVIFDVSHPNNMVEVGYYDTFTQGSGGGFDGCWGVYPYLPSGHIIASDITNGLFVLKASYKRGCFLEGLITDANTGQAIQGANVVLSGITENSLNTGAYATATADSGSYQVTYSKPGYNAQVINVTLSNGVVTVQDVQLVPQAAVAINIQVLETGTNAAIGSAKVELVESASGLSYNFTTNTSGNISNSVIATTYNMVVGKWGYVTKEITLTVSGAGPYTIYLDKGYYDDFYFDYSWVVSGNAQRGDWERGEPVGTMITQTQTPANPDEDVTNDIGYQCFVTGNGGGSVGSDDVDNGATILTSPTMDLSSYIEPVIYFNWWLFNFDAANQGVINDHYKVSLLNGTTSIPIFDYTGVHNTWMFDSIHVKDFVTPSANMKLVLNVEDATPGHLLEGGFDKLHVIDVAAPSAITSPFAENAHLKFIPNPVENRFQFAYDLPQGTNYSLELVDLQGKVIKTFNLANNKGSIAIDWQVASGLYFGRLMENGRVVKVEKIQKL
ncbi:MAG: choice-of-anchor B family protein [Bacteroidia bacterium]